MQLLQLPLCRSAVEIDSKRLAKVAQTDNVMYSLLKKETQ